MVRLLVLPIFLFASTFDVGFRADFDHVAISLYDRPYEPLDFHDLAIDATPAVNVDLCAALEEQHEAEAVLVLRDREDGIIAS